MVIIMNTSQKATVQQLPQTDNDIPTLDVPLHEPYRDDIKLEVLVGHMADELQAIFQQHLYQAMVKTLHQVVKQEGQKLSAKILDKLQQQLPEIIETGCQPHAHNNKAK
jgi:hypothetical protein